MQLRIMGLGMGIWQSCRGSFILRLTAFSVLALFAQAPVAMAENPLVNDAQLEHAGLTVEWYSNVGGGYRDQLVDWHLAVDENEATTIFIVSGNGYRESYSADQTGPNGLPLGIEGGLEFANIRKEIVEAELKAAGIEQPQVTVTQRVIPKTTLYTQTSRGLVRAFNAETGEKLWEASPGSSRFPSAGIGANDRFVAVANGSTIYCLEADSGKIAWSKHCRSIITAPPAVDSQHIYVPLINGKLERFSLAREGFAPVALTSKGRVTTRPLIAPASVCWGTDEGRFAAAARYKPSPSVAYQLNTDPIYSNPVYGNSKVFATSTDGFVYAIDERRGTLVWEVSTGASIVKSPALFGNSLFVINDRDELFKYDADSGRLAANWSQPKTDVTEFVGASAKKLYTLDKLGRLKILSRESGDIVGSVGIGNVSAVLGNDKTDRLYVADDRGNLRCIRESDSPYPMMHAGEMEAETAEATDQPATDQPKDMDSNPFGNSQPGDNPFDTGGDKPGSDNPFDQPGDDKKNDNPFDQPGSDDEPAGNPFGDPGGNSGSSSSSNPFEDG